MNPTNEELQDAHDTVESFAIEDGTFCRAVQIALLLILRRTIASASQR